MGCMAGQPAGLLGGAVRLQAAAGEHAAHLAGAAPACAALGRGRPAGPSPAAAHAAPARPRHTAPARWAACAPRRRFCRRWTTRSWPRSTARCRRVRRRRLWGQQCSAAAAAAAKQCCAAAAAAASSAVLPPGAGFCGALRLLALLLLLAHRPLSVPWFRPLPRRRHAPALPARVLQRRRAVRAAQLAAKVRGGGTGGREGWSAAAAPGALGALPPGTSAPRAAATGSTAAACLQHGPARAARAAPPLPDPCAPRGPAPQQAAGGGHGALLCMRGTAGPAVPPCPRLRVPVRSPL